MLIDVHAHLWGGKYQKDQEDILRAMKQYNIQKVYVSGLNGWSPNEAEAEEANTAVRNFMRQEPGRVEGYVYVNPMHHNSSDVIQRAVEDEGFSGIKLWIATLCDVPAVTPVAELAIQYGVPILVHAFHKATGQYPNESTGRHVAALARRFPALKIIMAHLGGNCYDGIPCIRDCRNVWVDYSGSIYRNDDLPYTIEILGEERILHGTDMPGACVVSCGQVMDDKISPAVREKIMWKNALRVFDRDVRGDEHEN